MEPRRLSKMKQKKKDMIAEQINELEPNFIILQEVRVGKNETDINQYEDLRKLLLPHNNPFWVIQNQYPNGHEEGTCYFSNYPIMSHVTHMLPNGNNNEDINYRVFLYVTNKFQINKKNSYLNCTSFL